MLLSGGCLNRRHTVLLVCASCCSLRAGIGERTCWLLQLDLVKVKVCILLKEEPECVVVPGAVTAALFAVRNRENHHLFTLKYIYLNLRPGRERCLLCRVTS